MAGDIKHTIHEGECLSKIAKHYGLTWQKIWDYGPNQAVWNKHKNPNPNLIFPGDVISIPEKEEKSESKPVDALQPFEKKKELPTFQIQIMFQGKPVKNLKAHLTVASPSLSIDKKGELDSDGYLTIDGSKDINVPSDSFGGSVVIGTLFKYSLQLCFSQLNTPHTDLGAKQRLYNLGYVEGSAPHSNTKVPKAVLYWFCKSNSHPPTDKIDSKLQTNLKDKHGC